MCMLRLEVHVRCDNQYKLEQTGEHHRKSPSAPVRGHTVTTPAEKHSLNTAIIVTEHTPNAPVVKHPEHCRNRKSPSNPVREHTPNAPVIKHPEHCHYRKSPSTPVIAPQWGAADAEIKVPSGENTELKRSSFQACSRSVYSHTCYAYCQGVLPCLFLPFQPIHLHFFQNLSRFFPALACRIK